MKFPYRTHQSEAMEDNVQKKREMVSADRHINFIEEGKRQQKVLHSSLCMHAIQILTLMW